MMKGKGIVKNVIEFSVGLVVGAVFAHFFLYLFLAPDEIQEQVARKAKCKTYKEYLSLLQSPEERLEFLEKHGKIIEDCREMSQEQEQEMEGKP